VDLPKDFFTPESALTLSGAVAMTYVVSNTCQAAFGFNPRWLALLIALVISLFGVWSTHGGLTDYVFGVVNACLIYLSAVGVSAVSAKRAVRTRGVDTKAVEPGKRTFLSPWW